jgi:hypothetical protein
MGGLWTLWVGLGFLEKKAAHPFTKGGRPSHLSKSSVYQLKSPRKKAKTKSLETFNLQLKTMLTSL